MLKSIMFGGALVGMIFQCFDTHEKRIKEARQKLEEIESESRRRYYNNQRVIDYSNNQRQDYERWN